MLMYDQTTFPLPICLVHVLNILSVLQLHFSLLIFGNCFVDSLVVISLNFSDFFSFPWLNLFETSCFQRHKSLKNARLLD